MSNMAIFPETKLMQSSPGNVNLKPEKETKQKKIQMSIYVDFLLIMLNFYCLPNVSTILF